MISKAGLPAALGSIAAWFAIVAANAALLGLIAHSPAAFVYDEGWYLGSVELVARHGALTREFIAALPGPAGPTYTWVYAAVEAVFGLSFPWLRLTNALLLFASAILVSASLREAQRRSGRIYLPTPWLIGGALTALPMVAVSAGMALTEMPAFFFVCLFLYLAVRAVAEVGDGRAAALPLAAAAGVCLGLAVLGRQNYLVVAACLPLLAPRGGRSIAVCLGLAAGVAAAIILPVFVIWGGLVPPGVARVSAGYSLWHFLLACAYAAVAALVLAPRLYRPLIARPATGIAVATIGGLLAPLAGFSFLPMRPFVEALLGEAAAGPIGSLAAIVLAVLGLAFLAALGLHTLRNLDDGVTRFGSAALLLGLLSVGRIEHVFSSRYSLVFFPFLVLALAPLVRPSWHLPPRLALGATLGCVSLARYFELL